MDRTAHRFGGILILAAALLGITGGVLHGPQPGTLEAFAELGSGWTVSHVSIALAGTLFAVGALFLGRHFAGTGSEAWALAGTGLLLLAGFAVLTIGAIETAGFGQLLGASEGGNAVAAGHAYLGASAVMVSMAVAGGFLASAAVAAYGVGILSAESWPGWLGWLGIVIGLGAIGVRLAGITALAAPQLALYVPMGWLGVVGIFLLGQEGPRMSAPARGASRAEPAVPEERPRRPVT